MDVVTPGRFVPGFHVALAFPPRRARHGYPDCAAAVAGKAEVISGAVKTDAGPIISNDSPLRDENGSADQGQICPDRDLSRDRIRRDELERPLTM